MREFEIEAFLCLKHIQLATILLLVAHLLADLPSCAVQLETGPAAGGTFMPADRKLGMMSVN